MLYNDYIIAVSVYNEFNDELNPYKGTWYMDRKGNDLELILEYCPNYLVAWGDTIYFDNEDDLLCSMNVKNKAIKEYPDVYVESGLNIYGDKVFYCNENRNICSYNLNTGKITMLTEDSCGGIIIADNWLVYNNYDSGFICAMKHDGSDYRRLLPLKN